MPLDLTFLTADQKAAYWRDGYLFPLDVMEADEAATWRAEIETIERDWLDAGLPRPLNAYKRLNANAVMPVVSRLASDRRILDAVEAILGPDIMVYGAELFIKEPQTRAMVSMHQDLTYWGLGATSGMVTAWLALSPATPASGCMEFVRESHRNPILPHQDHEDENNLLSRGQEVRVEVAPEDRTPIILAPGQMSLHHGLTIHGSGPNGSDDRRIGFVVRYIRPDVAHDMDETDYAMLVRGQDRFGHFRPVPAPAAPFAPEALAVWDAIRTAQAQVLMKGAERGKGLYE